MPKRRAKSREGMTVTTVALPNDVHRRLLIAAVENRIAFTEIVRQALIEWLSKHEKKTKGRAR